MKVLVFGGTHGNEWTGISVVNHYAHALKAKHKGLDLHFILANPEAHKLNQRFKDEDLNRAFQFLEEDRKNSYEHRRAAEIRALIDAGPCFVIDLHTTTSNMGNTLIVSHYDPLNFYLASRLTKNFTDCRVIGSPDPQRKYLASQSQQGLMIEIGPISNGLLEAKVLEQTLALLDQLLTELSSLPDQINGDLVLYEEVQHVRYPQNDQREILGYIHPDFQGKDFVSFNGKWAVFKTFEGQEIYQETTEEIFPIFINEAAYYRERLAFTLCRKGRKSF